MYVTVTHDGFTPTTYRFTAEDLEGMVALLGWTMTNNIRGMSDTDRDALEALHDLPYLDFPEHSVNFLKQRMLNPEQVFELEERELVLAAPDRFEQG